MLYLAFGYFISYLPCALADRTHCLADSDIPAPSATSLDDHRRTAVLIQRAARTRLAERSP